MWSPFPVPCLTALSVRGCDCSSRRPRRWSRPRKFAAQGHSSRHAHCQQPSLTTTAVSASARLTSSGRSGTAGGLLLRLPAVPPNARPPRRSRAHTELAGRGVRGPGGPRMSPGSPDGPRCGHRTGACFQGQRPGPGGQRSHLRNDNRHVHLRDSPLGPRSGPDCRRARTTLTAGSCRLRHQPRQAPALDRPRTHESHDVCTWRRTPDRGEPCPRGQREHPHDLGPRCVANSAR